MNDSNNELDIHQETEDIIKKIQTQMRLTESLLNSKSRYTRTMTAEIALPNKDSQNIIKIEDSSLEFVNIDDDFVKKPKDSPFDEVCSICSSRIYYDKYICVICRDCVLCTKCEKVHLHPLLKCKNNHISTLTEIFSYLSQNNSEIKKISEEENNNNSGFLGGIFGQNKTGYEFKLETKMNDYEMKQNEKMQLPIRVYNLNKIDIDCKKLKLILFSRGNKDLVIYHKELDKIIKSKSFIDTTISIQSNDFCKIYNFSIELYSNESVELIYESLSFKIRVVKDNEEEELNNYFKEYPEILIENKITKKGIKNIMENKDIKANAMTILQYFKKNHGNIHETIKSLKELNSDK